MFAGGHSALPLRALLRHAAATKVVEKRAELEKIGG
jgi:hypothetical protein